MKFTVGEKVQLEIGRPTNLGIHVLINGTQDAMLYHNEIFQPLTLGQITDGYIKTIRSDGKIDVSLQPQGFHKVIEQNCSGILDKLKAGKGILKLTDKSTPTEIQQEVNMSKKAFKAAIGQLYKQKKITIGQDGIYAVKK
ncbi:MAG: DNA-binding protein [Sphingobacteriales bacterium]|nr:DNA-binding protein [Sphingobacteriales bacterium]